MKVYVFWSDYDGAFCDSFEGREEAAIKVATIVAKEKSTDSYGTILHAVVEGANLDVRIVSRIDSIELCEAVATSKEDDQT